MAEQDTKDPIGECLRKIREEKSLSIEEISRITKISKRYLTAIENDDFEQLPAPTFARGFIRAYANFVGIDSEEIVQKYRERHEGLQKEDVVQLDSRLDRLQARWIAAAAVTLVVLVAGLLWWGKGEEEPVPSDEGRDTEQIETLKKELGLKDIVPEEGVAPDVEPGSKEVLVEGEVAVPPSEESGIELQVVAVEKTWIMVTVDDGEALEFMFEKGKSLNWTGDEKITIKVGNAGGVKLFLNGAPLEPLGPAGIVKSTTFTRESVGRLGLLNRNGAGSDGEI
ncbi:RodZ domain-containing protein [Thermodesulfobacteriota bacterium]